ncbi:MAG: hypothetical protein JW940_19050, partial [Polyangiaceae bacterium]|nr:hypothetical protein [Polyangiaceae bacterium]
MSPRDTSSTLRWFLAGLVGLGVVLTVVALRWRLSHDSAPASSGKRDERPGGARASAATRSTRSGVRSEDERPRPSRTDSREVDPPGLVLSRNDAAVGVKPLLD